MDLDVEGSLPHDLTGRYLCIGPTPSGAADVHAVALHSGRATSYRNRRVTTDDAHASSSSLVEFSGRTFSLSDGSLAHELAANLETLGPADLAGGARGVGAHPKLDRVSGELYLISSPGDAASLIHVISPGGMTRRTRSIDNAPGPVRDLALTTRHIVVVADGAIGMVERHDTETFSWHAIDSTAPFRVVSAHDGDTLVMYVTTPALERWSLHRDQREVRRTVIDPTPQSAGRINETRSGLPHRYLYSVAGQAVVKHDLLDGGRTGHDVGNGRRPAPRPPRGRRMAPRARQRRLASQHEPRRARRGRAGVLSNRHGASSSSTSP